MIIVMKIILLYSFSHNVSIFTVEKYQNIDVVILYCSVTSYVKCEHTVEWLYDGNKDDVTISPRSCSSAATFTPRLDQKSKYFESLKCNVTDKTSGQTLLCSVGPQSSCEKTGTFGFI